MKKNLLVSTILMLGYVNAQTQIGDDINGEAAYYNFGFCVSMPDSNTVGVGTPFYYENDKYLGQIRVYKRNGNTWEQKGSEINGNGYDESFGYSISMGDANTIAIGSPDNHNVGLSSGQVLIYEWVNDDWVQKGSEINGEAVDNLSGVSLSMPDSNTIAIGAHLNDGNGTDSGHVRIYTWDGNIWVQKGLDIDGESPNDYSGFPVNMFDSNTVAIGSPGNDTNGDFAGQVRIFNWDGTAWVQKGSNINGKNSPEQFGSSIDMPNINTVAIGTPYSNLGVVRVYNWDGTHWTQKGEDIQSDSQGDSFGGSISMPDENTISIGANLHSENGIHSGQTRIYKWSGNEWSQLVKINGEAAEDHSAISISMPDAQTIAIGAYKNDRNGTDAGQVRIFDLGNLGVIDNTLGRDISIYPNPTKGKFTVNLSSDYKNVQVIIRNILGQEIENKTYQSSNNKLELNINESNGLYLVELNIPNRKRAILKVLKK